MTKQQKAGYAALVAGLVAALLLHGAATPPVFDGIAVPPAPYHWESPPPNLRSGNLPPSPGEATFPVHNGQVAGGSLQTSDAQVVVYFGVGLFKLSSSAQSVRCTVTPMAPPPPPTGSQIRGNVYAITCVEQPSGQALQANGSFHLTMRYPSGPFQSIQGYDGSTWHALPTTQAGGGSPYAGATPSTFGDFAATAAAGARGPGILDFLGRNIEFYGILAFVIVFGVIAVIQELRRRRRRPRAQRRREARK